MEGLFRILCIFIVTQSASTQVAVNVTDDKIQGKTEHRIIGGTLARANEFKSVVGLDITQQKGENVWCTGTVLNDRTVLTAGHCIQRSVQIKILIDCIDMDHCHKTRMGKGYIHPSYAKIGNFIVYDVGVVKTEVSIGAQQFTKLSGKGVQAYSSCTVVGYGLTVKNPNPPHASRKLYKTTVEHVQPCSAFFPGDNRFNNMLCSYAHHGRQFYLGDSGGPLYCDKLQTGVSSQFADIQKDGKDETLMSWIIPNEFTPWLPVTASANRLSNMATIIIFMLFFIHA